MNNKVKIALIAVLLVAVVSLAIVGLSNIGQQEQIEKPPAYSAVVWLNDEEYAGEGDNLQEILESSLKGHNIIFNTNGSIKSVDGKGNTDSSLWSVYKWASPDGWKSYSKISGKFVEGTNLSVHYSEKTTDDKGNVSYSIPETEVEFEVHYFVQFKEQSDATEWMTQIATPDDREKGFWISGKGSNNNEAFANAMYTNFFSDSKLDVVNKGGAVTYLIDGKEGMFSHGTRDGMYGWFLWFLGWTDTKVNNNGGEYGTWTYWSQYSYNPNADSLDTPEEWGYNDWSFGMYDITDYRYFALVLQTTTADGLETKLPAPSEM